MTQRYWIDGAGVLVEKTGRHNCDGAVDPYPNDHQSWCGVEPIGNVEELLAELNRQSIATGQARDRATGLAAIYARKAEALSTMGNAAESAHCYAFAIESEALGGMLAGAGEPPMTPSEALRAAASYFAAVNIRMRPSDVEYVVDFLNTYAEQLEGK